MTTLINCLSIRPIFDDRPGSKEAIIPLDVKWYVLDTLVSSNKDIDNDIGNTQANLHWCLC
jgi:hypothetical protein